MERTLLQRFLFLIAVFSCIAPGFGQMFVNIAPTQGVDVSITNDNYGSGLSTYDFDKDGWDELTSIIEQASSPLKAFPNPVPPGEPLKLELSRSLDDVMIEFVDIHGKTIHRNFYDKIPLGPLEHSTPDVSSGMYFLHLTSPTLTGHLKIQVE